MAWQLTQCPWRDRLQLDALLRGGWEPFAVSETEYEPTVWLRQAVTREDALVVELRGRPRHEWELDR
jgi:hypothetical protein